MSRDLETLRDALREFARERDWDQFQSPKNLAAALSVEAAELLEHFQWLTEEQSRSLSAVQLEGVRQEMADVLLYLIRLADKLAILDTGSPSSIRRGEPLIIAGREWETSAGQSSVLDAVGDHIGAPIEWPIGTNVLGAMPVLIDWRAAKVVFDTT